MVRYQEFIRPRGLCHAQVPEEHNYCAIYADNEEYKYSYVENLLAHFPLSDEYINQVRRGVSYDIMQQGMNEVLDQRGFIFANVPGFEGKNQRLTLGRSLMQIAGDINFQMGHILFTQMYIMPVGKLKIKPLNNECPIKKVVITPANSTKPMLIDGYIDFGQNSKVELELINAAQVYIKYKKSAS